MDAEQTTLNPPPEALYETREILIEAAQCFARQQGYAVSIKLSGAEKRLFLKCDRGGLHVPQIDESLRKRRTNTRRIGCPFEISGKYLKKEKVWKLVVENAEHNHQPSMHPSEHPIHRKLTTEELSDVKRMTKAGVKPLGILTTIRDKVDVHASLRTIYNARANMRTEVLAGRTPIHALLDILRESEYTFYFDTDASGAIRALFFAHPESIELAQNYHHVALMDCIYMTNKYRLPLLHIIGMTSFNGQFSIAFCVLSQEMKINYVWALSKLASIWPTSYYPKIIVTDRELALMNALEDVFPTSANLLCTWHINKGVLANCKGLFSDGEEWDKFLMHWNCLVAVKSFANYEEKLRELVQFFEHMTKAIQYLVSTWLIHKENFVYAWTSNYMHFGNMATSRVEGSHAYIKRFIQTSVGDVLSLVAKITIAVKHQIMTEQTQRSREQFHHMIGISPAFEAVSGKISLYALRLCEEQFKKMELELEDCTESFTGTMGIVCAHKMPERLTLGDFHPQWHLQWQPVPNNIVEASNATISEQWRSLGERFLRLPNAQEKKLRKLINYLRAEVA